MRRKNLLKELGIQKQADTSCNALDIDTENIRQRVYAKLDFADTERKQTTMRSKKKILCRDFSWFRHAWHLVHPCLLCRPVRV